MQFPGAGWLKALDLKGHQFAAAWIACAIVLVFSHYNLLYLGELSASWRVFFAVIGITGFCFWSASVYTAIVALVKARRSRRTVHARHTHSFWHLGSSGGSPAMQVESRWQLTSVSEVNTSIDTAYLRSGFMRPWIEAQFTHMSPTRSGERSADLILSFWIVPPFKARGQDFRASIKLIDRYGNAHVYRGITIPSDWKPKPEPKPEPPVEALHTIKDSVEKQVAAILKDEVNRYKECGREAGGLGSVQVTYRDKTYSGIGYQGRQSRSPRNQWIVPDPDTARIHSDNIDRLLGFIGGLGGEEKEKALAALKSRVSLDSEYTPIAYFILLAFYRTGELEEALETIRHQLEADKSYHFDDSVKMLSGLIQYDYANFSDEMLDASEKFVEGLTGFLHHASKRIVAARAFLADA